MVAAAPCKTGQGAGFLLHRRRVERPARLPQGVRRAGGQGGLGDRVHQSVGRQHLLERAYLARSSTTSSVRYESFCARPRLYWPGSGVSSPVQKTGRETANQRDRRLALRTVREEFAEGVQAGDYQACRKARQVCFLAAQTGYRVGGNVSRSGQRSQNNRAAGRVQLRGTRGRNLGTTFSRSRRHIRSATAVFGYSPERSGSVRACPDSGGVWPMLEQILH